MTLIEAAKLAREAFEWNFNTDLDNIPACERWAKMLKENINALDKAIAKAEQQELVDKNGSPCPEFWDWLPKAYWDGDVGDAPKFTKFNMEVAFFAGKKSVAASDTSKERVDEIAKQRHEQWPVAWMYDQARYGPTDLRGQQWLPALSRLRPWDGNGLVRNVQPLYTSPPASKPWVGLTDKDKQIAFDDTQEGGGFWEFADAIEAKLKEKNT